MFLVFFFNGLIWGGGSRKREYFRKHFTELCLVECKLTGVSRMVTAQASTAHQQRSSPEALRSDLLLSPGTVLQKASSGLSSELSSVN